VEDLRAVELDQRDLPARSGDSVGVHHPRGMQRHQARRLHLPVTRPFRTGSRTLLIARSGQRQDLGIARIGRRVPERQRRDRRRAQDLVHQAELDLAEALSSELGIEVRRPQALPLDLVLERPQRNRETVPSELVEQRLEWPDVLADKRRHPLEVALELGLGREIPGHWAEGYS
jgi:hypothetical protein